MKTMIQSPNAALDWLGMLTGRHPQQAAASRFHRELLPDPISYYADQGLKLRGKGAWRTCLCPFHTENNPSFAVHVESGAFRCQACGEKGGDVLAFHCRLHHMGFIEAAQHLGAWEARR